jgi:hypothetical protein
MPRTIYSEGEREYTNNTARISDLNWGSFIPNLESVGATKAMPNAHAANKIYNPST